LNGEVVKKIATLSKAFRMSFGNPLASFAKIQWHKYGFCQAIKKGEGKQN
jgi:hypothetical protein